jgi:hypothetical protein
MVAGCMPGLAGLLQMKQSVAFLSLSRRASSGEGKKPPISSSAIALDGLFAVRRDGAAKPSSLGNAIEV